MSKIYVSSDLHLGHSKMPEYCGRPENHSEIILANLEKMRGDIIINCGDICIGKDDYWHTRLMLAMDGFKRKILVRGNHDRKTSTWYRDHGWDDVVDDMVLAMGKYGRVYFSHKPTEKEVANKYSTANYNVHGHWHNKDHSADIPWYDKKFHKKISCEDFDYKPILLTDLLNI